MTTRKTVVTEVSTRSPRTAWNRPRTTTDCIAILQRNGFLDAGAPVGIAFVRVVGALALRVTIANGQATLDTALRADGQPVRWRPTRERIGTATWQVTREALELLATLDVDTPVRWG